MTSAPVAALVVVLTLAAVLLSSGVAKLRDARATRDAFDALRVPRAVPVNLVAPALPWVEVALGVLLLVAPAGPALGVTLLVLGLMLAYTALVARALGFEEPVACSCFGRLGRHEVDRTTLLRNGLLVALAAAAAWLAVDGGSVPALVADLDAAGWSALLATAVAVVVAVLVLGRTSSPRALAPDELLDYERQPIPYGVLVMHDGTTATLAELAATQARLLVVLSPGCGPCVRIAATLDAWAGRLAPAVAVLAVYPDASTVQVTGHAPDLATSEPARNIRRVFSVGTPAAILLGADGYLAGGPVAGEDAVAAFFDEVLEAVAEQPSPTD